MGLIRGEDLFNLKVLKSTKDNILSLFNIKHFDLHDKLGLERRTMKKKTRLCCEQSLDYIYELYFKVGFYFKLG